MIGFNEWLISEGVQRQIYYHGTGGQMLKSILSQGLIPDVKKRVWSDESDGANFDHSSRASLGGIYVTNNLLTALSSAYKAGGDNRVIVVMDIHPFSLIGDEDDYISFASVTVHNALTTEYTLSWVYFPWKVLNTPKLLANTDETWQEEIRNFVEKSRNAYVEKCISRIAYKLKNIHPKLLERVKDLIYKEGFPLAIERSMSYLSAYEYARNCEKNLENCPEDLKQPDKIVAEKKWREFLDRVTRTMKQVSYPGNDNFNNTARIMTPVRFSGKNKIVCILELIGRDTFIRYGHAPEQLIQEWESKIGEWKPKF